ncbi:uncharacterized protein LOC110269244 [Arachis ipaensis]|uniref:uncharacterized protein LOC110269244 n=1 Tax=Arachis ipaensis TaxID=130454 RepID=UPI000A2B7CBE|nr:uncharacterized protein LOC110269244 [Arachis ipaensis]
MSSSFPSSHERSVASALLLLQTTSPTLSFSTPKSSSDSKYSVPEGSRSRSKSFRDRSVSCASDRILASASSVTNDNGVSSGEEEEEKPIKPRCVSFLSATARYHQMKFKVDLRVILVNFLFQILLCFVFCSDPFSFWNQVAEQTVLINCFRFPRLIPVLEFRFVLFLVNQEAKEVQVNCFRFTLFDELLIVRKIRSKVIWTASCSGHRKPKAITASEVSSGSLSGDASSSLSSSSSARSLRYANRVRSKSVRVAAIRHEEEPPPPQQQQLKREKNARGSPHLRRRGEAILKLLTVGVL